MMQHHRLLSSKDSLVFLSLTLPLFIKYADLHSAFGACKESNHQMHWLHKPWHTPTSSHDWRPTQRASTEAPVVKTVLFAFSDLSLYLGVKQPGSSKVSWHLNSFSWPASPWDWSDLNAEAFKRMPSCTAEQHKLTTDHGLCIYLDF